MIGAMDAAGQLNAMFSGDGHAPSPVTHGECNGVLDQAPRDVRFDMQDWLLNHFDAALGVDADRVLGLMQSRAGVFLRVNTSRANRETAIASLREDGITACPVSDVKTALQVIENERRIAISKAYLSGLVELQDPSSQQAILDLGISRGLRVLDYCAGGGGKALAMAALGADVTAHDIDPRRMADIGPRAARAGVEIKTAAPHEIAAMDPFDLVLCDAPCSGSGTWRRTPMAKWELTPERLNELRQMQANVLRDAAPLVRPNGRLVYATCSVFQVENEKQIELFIDQYSSFSIQQQSLVRPSEHRDGFFLSMLRFAD